jgi:hypothetical protein
MRAFRQPSRTVRSSRVFGRNTKVNDDVETSRIGDLGERIAVEEVQVDGDLARRGHRASP